VVGVLALHSALRSSGIVSNILTHEVGSCAKHIHVCEVAKEFYFVGDERAPNRYASLVETTVSVHLDLKIYILQYSPSFFCEILNSASSIINLVISKEGSTE
jgi:hypothetical protein